MTLLEVHEVFGWFVVVSNGVTGVWVLTTHWRPQFQTKLLWPAVAVAQFSIAIQVILGVLLQQASELEASGIHMFYAFVAFATVGLMYSYRQQVEQWRFLLYGFGGLFLMGLASRSMGWI